MCPGRSAHPRQRLLVKPQHDVGPIHQRAGRWAMMIQGQSEPQGRALRKRSP